MAFLFGFYCVREYSYLFRIFTPLPSVAAFAGNGDYANAQFPVSGERGEGYRLTMRRGQRGQV